VSITPIANPSAISGSQQANDAIPSITPFCDIRAYGAVINGTTPIDSAVQTCINLVNSLHGGTGTIFLPCGGQTGGLPWGRYLANSSLLTGPTGGTVKFALDGHMLVGSTLVG